MKKVENATKVLDSLKVEGTEKAMITGLIANLGIGQNTVLVNSLPDVNCRKALTAIFKALNSGTKKADLKVTEKLADLGFNSKDSLINFADQLVKTKPEQVEYLKVVLANEKLADVTVKAIGLFFKTYTYKA